MDAHKRFVQRRQKRGPAEALPAAGSQAPQQSLIDEWEQLCDRFLPVETEDSIWRFSRHLSPADPEQGWKLHISATILSAAQVLQRIGPLLCETGALFKAPHTLEELQRLNCGLYYGFSQIGKFITIYPQNYRQALFLARKLHRLTYQLPAPEVPFDLQFRKQSSVFYRYGGFSEIEIEQADGNKLLAIRDQEGALIPDRRSWETAAPDWVVNPFLPRRRRQKAGGPSPLQTTIRAFESLSQRGKGGVYRAVDLSVSPVRLCLLKEGRRHGETDWDGRDGYWRVRHEGHVLTRLMKAGVAVPQVYRSFTVESNYYLATEYIEGVNLQSLLIEQGKKLPLAQALQFGIQAATLLHQIHSAGWVWRDCKPLNFILTESGDLRPIDFEGACPINQPDPTPWGTARYAAPECQDETLPVSRMPEDLFALGITLSQLFSGEIPTAEMTAPAIKNLSRRVPPAVKKIVSDLLNRVPQQRPQALMVAELLKAV